jgi:hypothetical protein
MVVSNFMLVENDFIDSGKLFLCTMYPVNTPNTIATKIKTVSLLPFILLAGLLRLPKIGKKTDSLTINP